MKSNSSDLPSIRSATSRSRSKGQKPSREPFRWDSLPHEELGKRAEQVLLLGSRQRAAEDARFYIAKRRLGREDPGAHSNYAQYECARLVERLRAIRDVYREHLTNLGCRPLGQTSWAVFRFGVMEWAIRVLRSSVRQYVTLTPVRRRDWEELFGGMRPIPLGAINQLSADQCELVQDGPELEASIARRLPKGVFDQILTGGPFGREAQVYLVQEMAGVAMLQGESFPEILARKQRLWDNCSLWAELLGGMFDAVQEELIFQANGLSDEGRRWHELFPHLSQFQQIAYKHLVSLRPSQEPARLGDGGWLALTRELDQNGVLLNEELSARAKKVLDSVRRRGAKIGSWEDGYVSKARTSLEDGKTYSIRRELTMAVYNAAKSAEYVLRKSGRDD